MKKVNNSYFCRHACTCLFINNSPFICWWSAVQNQQSFEHQCTTSARYCQLVLCIRSIGEREGGIVCIQKSEHQRFKAVATSTYLKLTHWLVILAVQRRPVSGLVSTCSPPHCRHFTTSFLLCAAKLTRSVFVLHWMHCSSDSRILPAGLYGSEPYNANS